MSGEASGSSTTPNLNLTPDEKRLYGQLFRQADTDGVGVVTGDVAVTFFEKTRLDSTVLGEIWQLADKENRGFLTPAGFGIVLRLIGHAQAGREPTREVALQPGPLPRFDGFAPPAAAPIQAQGTGGGIRIPPLTQDKVAQYTSLFERQTLQGNNLPGEQARSIFDRSGLPNETLGRIWSLADTEQRGALVQTEFVIAMHLLTSMKSGALRSLPNAVPAGLYEAATGRAPILQSPRGSNAGIPRQLTGAGAQRTGSPLGRSVQQGSDWLVTPADKTRFDQLYATLDKTNKGYITGEEAVPFFSQSSLSEEALAQIWDLSDVNSQGHLKREEFAVAMYLIRQQRLNPAAPVPTTLPHNLVPPTMRNLSRPPPVSSPFDPPPMKQPPPPQPKSALEDLFGLDSSSPSPAPRQNTMSTGGSGTDPFAGGSNIQTPSSPVGANPSFKPFVPTSTFGRGLTTQPSDSAPAASQQSTSEDLLADSEPEASKKITGETTELANLSHQIGTLSKQMQDTQSKRTATQAELNQTNSQKQNFEQRLAQLRQLYEKEAQDTRSLEEQLRNSRAETKKLQGECMSLEGNLRDAQTQHQQVLAGLQSDQQENTALREKIRVANAQITQLKPQIEKLKMEARQQKGLVAINKKQLLTTEGERDRLKGESESISKGSSEDLTRQGVSTAASNTPQQVASPALSTASGNNPFFKRTASSDIMGVFAVPGKSSTPDNSFDEVFGPTGAQPPAPVPAQNTGTSTASVGSYSNTPGSTPALSRQATLRTDNPPAPPESRQISSSFLPFPDQTESLSSSRQVSPPASRAEGSVTETTGSVTSKTPEAPTDKPDDQPAAVKDETAAKAPEVESKEEDKQPVFEQNDQDKAKADFDNAFAAFTSSKGSAPPPDTTAKGKSAFDTEFPPISEIERDESDSESEPEGFDDDFAPASPEAKKTSQPAEESDKGKGIAGAVGAVGAVGAAGAAAVDSSGSADGTDASISAEQPSSPATVTNATANAGQSADDIFGPAPTTTATAEADKSAQAKDVFDDADDDFEGLEDAKEGSADDDFANISRSGLDDYNPVFDSSPPPSQTKSESAFGNESSFDFIPSNPTGAPSGANAGQQKGTEAHDWDAIFAGLDSSDTTAPTLDAGDSKPVADKSDDRPSGPGRALTDKGEHDDPILKSLTGMGYSRTDAVAALEQYDYNLERAANFLASKS